MNILIFGDSITWEAHDPKQGGWATHLRNYLEEKSNNKISVYNLGINGDTTTNLLERIEIETKSREPDLIIFAIGINDATFIHSLNNTYTPLNQFQKNLERLFDIAKNFTNNIIFIGLTKIDELKINPSSWEFNQTLLNKDIEQFDNTIKEFCENNKIKFISMKGIIENKDLYDGLHPNTQGHIKMFNQILPEIKLML